MGYSAVAAIWLSLKLNDRLSLWLRDLHPIWFVSLMVSASFLALVPFAILASVFPALAPGPGSSVVKYGAVGQIAFGVVLAPLLETALYQALPIELMSRKTSFGWPLIIAISSILFGAAHRFSWGYVFATFLVGLVLAYGYAVRRRKGGRPFLLILSVHALRNAISLALFASGVPYPS
ncbi:MAG: CPBP family glutamic-type intramembrane protease [Steroidobacteraceae bacterium]